MGCKILCSKSSEGFSTDTITEDWAAKWKHISGSNISISFNEFSEPKSSTLNLKLPVKFKFSF